jgi:hypothetical protein
MIDTTKPLERDAEIEKARKTMRRIGKKLLSERELFDPHDEKTGTQDKDILSLLVHANASGEGDQRISEEQILARKRLVVSPPQPSSEHCQKYLRSLWRDMKRRGEI